MENSGFFPGKTGTAFCLFADKDQPFPSRQNFKFTRNQEINLNKKDGSIKIEKTKQDQRNFVLKK